MKLQVIEIAKDNISKISIKNAVAIGIDFDLDVVEIDRYISNQSKIGENQKWI